MVKYIIVTNRTLARLICKEFVSHKLHVVTFYQGQKKTCSKLALRSDHIMLGLTILRALASGAAAKHVQDMLLFLWLLHRLLSVRTYITTAEK